MARLSAGARKRKNGILEKRFTVNGTRHSVYASTVKELNKRERELRKQIEEGAYASNTTITLNQYFEEWSKTYEKSVKPTTYQRTTSAYMYHFHDGIGKKKLVEIEPRMVKKVCNDIQSKMKSSSSHNNIGVLRMIFRAAVDDGIIAKSPMPKMREKSSVGETKARDTIHRALTEEETALFFEEAKNDWMYELFLFFLSSGVRCGEATALVWGDVDFKNNVIHINKTTSKDKNGKRIISQTTKTQSSMRDIPISNVIREILLSQRNKTRLLLQSNVVPINEADTPIFPSVRGNHMSGSNINQHISWILGRLEKKGNPIDHFTVHAFRDTFATRCIENGMNPQTLKTILGHSSFSMTMDLYAHVLPNTKQEEMDNVNGAFKTLII